MSGKLTQSQKDELIEQIKQQMAVANAQKLFKSMSEKCFKKCVNKPGTALDNSESKCVSLCVDRFFDCWNNVSRVYTKRIRQVSDSGFS